MNKDPLAFLQHFGDNFWLQTFDDKKKDKTLVSDWMMMPNESLPLALTGFNEKNAGVYFCVNELRHMHKKRNADNVETIRAFFCDLDGAPLEPVLRCGLRPNIIVCSSEDRWHAYWLMNDRVPADRRLFKDLQRSIAKRFGGDESVSDLCRVMRLPGFYNMKKEPFMVTWEVLAEKPYSLVEVENEFRGQANDEVRGNNHSVNSIVGWSSNDALSLDAGRGGIKNAAEDLEFDASRLRGALLSINSDDYDSWVNVGLALQGAARRADAELSEEEAFEYWISWSELSPKYDAVAAEVKWQGLEARGEMGLGTVFQMAQDAGWKGERRLTWSEDEWLEKQRLKLGIKKG